jgi:glycosyltransferase involved in cell wall biosynthesis
MSGLPIVTTKTGVRGLNVHDRYHVIISEPDNFAVNIERLLKNDALRNKIIANALRFVKNYDAHEIANDVSTFLVSALELPHQRKPTANDFTANETADELSGILGSGRN